MVKFASYTLPHVLETQTTNARQEIDRPIPYRTVAYRADQADLGKTIKLKGEIRAITIEAAHAAIEAIRALNNETDGSLDMEDGKTSPIQALLIDPEFEMNIKAWFTGKYWVAYSLTFLEVPPYGTWDDTLIWDYFKWAPAYGAWDDTLIWGCFMWA
jgi:hypothetical protein